MSEKGISNYALQGRLTPYLSPMGAWALALGTSIGWGSLVVTSNSYLSQAGPLGSVLGMLIGAALMIVISWNYHYLINRFPDAGGAYAYAREAFGYDYGFLTAWFLALTYMAMFWANATSLPLFARFFLGDAFQVGALYTLFGYQVYIGEALLSMVFIAAIALLCIRSRKITMRLMIGMAVLISAVITLCFAAAILGHGASGYTMEPALIPDKSGLAQVIRIACISPWAFIGFENISHASEEYNFPRRKVFRILTVAVITSMLLYIFILLLSVTAYPQEYGSWTEYLADLNNIEGIKGLPAFYAAHHYLGQTGVILLFLALLSLILTSLIGNMLALSRLLYAMGKDDIIPGGIHKISKYCTPAKAIICIAVISLFIPFLGRTAIGWIVDVTTLGATIIYGFVSASAVRVAGEGDRTVRITGVIGVIVMILIALFLLLPNLLSSGSMAMESYLLFTVWAILGFLFFRSVLHRDEARRFGRSMIVWIALLALIFFTSLAWMSASVTTAADGAISSIHQYWSQELGTAQNAAEEQFISQQMDQLQRTSAVSTGVVVIAFVIALGMLLSNYALINRRIVESEQALLHAETKANTDPLTGVKSKHAYVEKESRLNLQIDGEEDLQFAIVVCDVNGLKHVNDTLGHKAGDEYICSASRMICELFQHSPVFRVGGDEFIAILSGRDYEERDYLMRRLHEKSVENIGFGKVVVAGGISEFDPVEDSMVRDVFERADALMYEEKQALKKLGARSR